jgi:predicted phosphodiesterase
MALIGILSYTHAYLGDYVYRFFDDCEEIWHAGDVGSLDVLQALQHFKPTRAVWGNIDGSPIRKEIPAVQFIKYQGLRVFMRHIVGYPNKYDKSVVPDFTK